MSSIKQRIRARHATVTKRAKKAERRVKSALVRAGVPRGTVNSLASRGKRAVRMAVRGQVKRGKAAVRARAMRL